MKYDFDLTVIGGGSAGLLAARVAPNLGVKTALIERGRLGGDCLWTGCVPSKALLASAKAAHTLHTADRFGLPASDAPIDTAKVWQRIHDIQEEIAAHEDSPEAVAAGGTEVIFGEALVEDGHRVRVGDRVPAYRRSGRSGLNRRGRPLLRYMRWTVLQGIGGDHGDRRRQLRR